MKKAEILKRYLLFIISLFFSGLGVAFAKHGALGVTPISSIPNILSIRFDFLTIGNWLILWNCLLLVAQIIILRKKFQLVQLLQIPLSFLFGYFTDFGMWIVSFIPVDYYPMQLLMVICGVIVLGFGISLSVIANVVLNSGEAFVKAVSDTVRKDFSTVKIFFDVLYVIIAVLLSLLFFHGEIKGTREGTVIAAIGTGLVVKLFLHFLKKPVERLLISQ